MINNVTENKRETENAFAKEKTICNGEYYRA
jgi:hypothetical protein